MVVSVRQLPRQPIVLDVATHDPSVVHGLIDAHAPYWPVQRYFANGAEYAALSGRDARAPMVVAPVFRGNWAADGTIAPGVEPFLHHGPFIEAAKRLFDAEIVRPTTVYVNLTYQIPFPQGAGHTDVPVFRGFDRTRNPITFLTLMGLSGLFEDVRVKVATAVAWFYGGPDGGFEYWPEGPDRPSRVYEGAIDNTAIVGDNDFMWHRVRPTGRVEDGVPSITLDSELRGGGDRWAIVDGVKSLASFPRDRLRVSLSWKGLVFESDADRRRYDDGTADIDLPEILRRFTADLGRRGVEAHVPSDPLRDPAFIDLLRTHYVRYPSGVVR